LDCVAAHFGDQCYDFKNIFAKKLAQIGVLLKLLLVLWKNYDNIGFWEKRQFFRRKISKIAEDCDHNIDPWF
jgi:hypothetical protein